MTRWLLLLSLSLAAQDLRVELPPEWGSRTSASPGVEAWYASPGDSVQVFLLRPEPAPAPTTSLDQLKAAVAELGAGLAEAGATVLGYRSFALGDGGIAAYVEYTDPRGALCGQAVFFHPERIHRALVRGAPWPGVELQPALASLFAGVRFADEGAPHLPEEVVPALDQEIAFPDLGIALSVSSGWEADGAVGPDLAGRFTLPDGTVFEVWGSLADEALGTAIDALAAQQPALDFSERELWQHGGLPRGCVVIRRDGQPTGDALGLIDLGPVKVVVHLQAPAAELPFRRKTLRAMIDAGRRWTR